MSRRRWDEDRPGAPGPGSLGDARSRQAPPRQAPFRQSRPAAPRDEECRCPVLANSPRVLDEQLLPALVAPDCPVHRPPEPGGRPAGR